MGSSPGDGCEREFDLQGREHGADAEHSGGHKELSYRHHAEIDAAGIGMRRCALRGAVFRWQYMPARNIPWGGLTRESGLLAEVESKQVRENQKIQVHVIARERNVRV
jgi:hypothetical protein